MRSGHSYPQLRAADVDAVRRRKGRVDDREVVICDSDDGMTSVYANVFATDGHAVDEQVDALAAADKHRGRRRTTAVLIDSPPAVCCSGMLDAMTEPQFSGSENGNAYPPPGQYPPMGQYPPAYLDPAAPYGRHPLTAEPLSDKSKVIAGLLQLLGLFGVVGIGRIYLGYTGLGVAQLVVGLVTCGLGAMVWGSIDAILILVDKVRDPQGRPLRDGT